MLLTDPLFCSCLHPFLSSFLLWSLDHPVQSPRSRQMKPDQRKENKLGVSPVPNEYK